MTGLNDLWPKLRRMRMEMRSFFLERCVHPRDGHCRLCPALKVLGLGDPLLVNACLEVLASEDILTQNHRYTPFTHVLFLNQNLFLYVLAIYPLPPNLLTKDCDSLQFYVRHIFCWLAIIKYIISFYITLAVKYLS